MENGLGGRGSGSGNLKLPDLCQLGSYALALGRNRSLHSSFDGHQHLGINRGI